MKTRIYLRVAKGGKAGFRCEASAYPDNLPIQVAKGYNHKEFLPTVAFAVDFDIPDDLFKSAERVVASINIAMKEAEVTGEMLVPKIAEIKKELKKAAKR